MTKPKLRYYKCTTIFPLSIKHYAQRKGSVKCKLNGHTCIAKIMPERKHSIETWIKQLVEYLCATLQVQAILALCYWVIHRTLTPWVLGKLCPDLTH